MSKINMLYYSKRDEREENMMKKYIVLVGGAIVLLMSAIPVSAIEPDVKEFSSMAQMWDLYPPEDLGPRIDPVRLQDGETFRE